MGLGANTIESKVYFVVSCVGFSMPDDNRKMGPSFSGHPARFYPSAQFSGALYMRGGSVLTLSDALCSSSSFHFNVNSALSSIKYLYSYSAQVRVSALDSTERPLIRALSFNSVVSR